MEEYTMLLRNDMPSSINSDIKRMRSCSLEGLKMTIFCYIANIE